MPYATVPDIITRYGESLLHSLLDREGEELDQAAVEAALADASQEVDLYLRARAALPLSPVPDVIKRATIDLALAMLPTQAAGDNDLIQQRAAAARKLLAAVAEGALTLGLFPPAGAAGGGGVLFSGPGMVFTPDALKDF